MQNNPFRTIPSTNVEDWGKSKFKAKNFANGGKSRFHSHVHGNKTFNNRKGSNFHKSKETYKFNEVAHGVKPDNATPWSKYKDEIVYKEREVEQAALQSNMACSEAKKVLKQREVNYRRSLIQQKKEEPIEWEEFGEEERSVQNQTSNKFTKNEIGKSNIKNHKQKHVNIMRNNTDGKNIVSKTKFKKNVSSSELKFHTNELISNELLENFDSKKLNYKQNDTLRGAITKTTIMASGGSLEEVVKNMKRKAMKKANFNKK